MDVLDGLSTNKTGRRAYMKILEHNRITGDKYGFSADTPINKQ